MPLANSAGGRATSKLWSRQQRYREKRSTLLLQQLMKTLPVLCCREGVPVSLGGSCLRRQLLGLRGEPPRLA